MRLLAAAGGLLLGLATWAGVALAQSPAPAVSGAASQGRGPLEYTVQPGDTLWDLAVRFYGDGSRFPTIVTANTGRAMADGQRLTDAGAIKAGWKLLLPPAATSSGEAPREYTV